MMEDNKMNAFDGELTDQDAEQENAALSSESLDEVVGASASAKHALVKEDGNEDKNVVAGKRYGNDTQRLHAGMEDLNKEAVSKAEEMIKEAGARFKDLVSGNEK